MKQFVTLICLLLFICCARSQDVQRNAETGEIRYTDPRTGVNSVCDGNCKDQKNWCGVGIANAYCNHTFWGAAFRVACPRSCGICKKCPHFAQFCTPGDGCKDEYENCATVLAPLYCKHSTMGAVVQQKCPKSCGICRTCDERTQECSPGCSDADRDCPYWANNMEYCKPGSVHRGWMLEHCRMSCRVCIPCVATVPARPTAPPTTPPPPPTTAAVTPTPAAVTNSVEEECMRNRGQSLTFADQCLNAHNYYRCLHSSPRVVYDAALQRNAQRYANKLPTMDSIIPSQIGMDRDFGVGENIAWRISPFEMFTVDRAIAGWYAEGLDYNFMTPQLSERTAHFTQMIWKETHSIGCGIKTHKDETYIVVQYRGAGNNPSTLRMNVNWPKPEVCEANCDLGSCHGHDGVNSICSCGVDGVQDRMPNCSGHCVVICPRPEQHVGDWRESCEGETSCECKNQNNIPIGGIPGAQCDQ
nr:ectin-like [Ciona intestinalis]|eukprot:XP_002123836.1 ectin-like [Ciona intestinalis]